MTEEKAKEVWTIDDLVALTETVQSAEVEYQGKLLPIQWCELTESEEPKIAQLRVGKMISKANTMNPDNITLTDETWIKLPTTIRWQVSGKILGGETSEDFING
jgi:hypothetical protein